MDITIKQTKLKFNYEYKIYSESNLLMIGEANRTLLPMRRIIRIKYPDGSEICTLQQQSLIKLILSYIPIINWFKFSICPFEFYYLNNRIGYMNAGRSGVTGLINNDVAIIKPHSDNYYSIHLNNNHHQIALIKKNNYKQFDGDEYCVNFDSGQKVEIISCLCVYLDIIWNTSDRTLYSNSYEKVICFGDEGFSKEWRA